MTRLHTTLSRRLLGAGAALALGLTLTAPAPAQAATHGPDFYSDFTGNATGWTTLNGTWTTGATSYVGTGLTSHMATIRHSSNYANFVYTARIKNAAFANYLWFRGSGTRVGTSDFWANAYAIGWTTTGQYAVFKTDAAGTSTTLIPQRAEGAFSSTGFNIVRVTAAGGIIGFTVNGVPISAIADTSLATGKVGIGIFSVAAGETITVDRAKLKNIPDSVLAKTAPVTKSRVLFSRGTVVAHPKVDLLHPTK